MRGVVSYSLTHFLWEIITALPSYILQGKAFRAKSVNVRHHFAYYMSVYHEMVVKLILKGKIVT